MKNFPLSPSRRSDVRILTVLISVMTAVILVYGMAVRPARSAAAKLRGQDIFTPGSTKIATQEEASIPSVDAQLSSGHSRAVQQSRAMHSFNSPAASYTNSTAITITDCPSPCPASGQAASLYPSPLTAAGEVG